MKYRFILTYQATDSETTATRTCFPLHGDDLAISINREEGEWYYTRNLEDKLVFINADYAWIMGCEFDGTFTLNIQESHDGGATYYDYFTGTFSRASLEIDEDNKQATLNGIKEGFNNLIKNGAKEEYDLMKLIPDSEAKEVQGQVPPALALVDECSALNKPSFSDIFCNTPIVSGGYKDDIPMFWASDKDMRNYPYGSLVTIWAEANVVMRNTNSSAKGHYTGDLGYRTNVQHGIAQYPDFDFYFTSIDGAMYNNNNYRLNLVFENNHITTGQGTVYYQDVQSYIELYQGTTKIAQTNTIGIGTSYRDSGPTYSPVSYQFTAPNSSLIESITINIHYIYSSLLLAKKPSAIEILIGLYKSNILETGPYYLSSKRMDAGWIIYASTINTSEQPNGHRIVPSSDEYDGTPRYFAPPDDTNTWIPLAEDNWNYASLWYIIVPSIDNGLLDPTNFGTFTWTRCWTIGTCIKYLLNRITDGKVVFNENTDYSQFLYGNPNPVEDHEPFQWLVTQKSNVMRPAATGAARCPAKLDWFLELLRNAFNCYYWLEKVNGGTYNFRIEHVEYFRRGGAYSGDLADQLDLTRLKPYRNFLRNGQPAKRYADQTNRYTFDLDGMVEKYTYSWQGDGGSDDFKGNPMYFKAGWIEKGSSDDRQVDNIFADLGWLMLNAGTDTASSKNYDGLFIFGGYQPEDSIGGSASRTGIWKENTPPTDQYMTIAEGSHIVAFMDIWYTAPEGYMVTVDDGDTLHPYIGTGSPQVISFSVDELYIGGNHYLRIDFGTNYTDVVIHRIHARSGNTFYVPNVRNLLRTNTVNYLQNGVLAWPWLQCEYLHYDIPAAKWTYLKDEYTDNPDLVWEPDGTIKMVKKQTLAVVPVPDDSTEDSIMGIMGVKTGLGIGIIDSAKINLSSRNAEMTIIYDINPQNN